MNTNLMAPLVLTLLFFSHSITLQGQSLSEKLGGVKTNFVITTSDNTILNDASQLLIKRPVSRFNTECIGEGGGGYGYAYESFHLEFQTDNTIKLERRKARRKGKILKLRFYDDNGSLLADIEQSLGIISSVNNGETPLLYTYSIDLKNIPLAFLDKTVKIDITRYKFLR